MEIHSCLYGTRSCSIYDILFCGNIPMQVCTSRFSHLSCANDYLQNSSCLLNFNMAPTTRMPFRNSSPTRRWYCQCYNGYFSGRPSNANGIEVKTSKATTDCRCLPFRCRAACYSSRSSSLRLFVRDNNTVG
jgi:hypothetical protein